MQIWCAEGNDHGVCVSHGSDKRGIVSPCCNAHSYCGNDHANRMQLRDFADVNDWAEEINRGVFDEYEIMEHKAEQQSWFGLTVCVVLLLIFEVLCPDLECEFYCVHHRNAVYPRLILAN